MSIPAATETAVSLASQAFALAMAANASEDHACQRAGTFGHAWKAARAALLVAFDTETVTCVCEAVSDTNEHTPSDIMRYVAERQEECHMSDLNAILHTLEQKYAKEIKGAEKALSDDTDYNVVLMSALNARYNEYADMQNACSRMSAKKFWGGKLADINADKTTLSNLVEKNVL